MKNPSGGRVTSKALYEALEGNPVTIVFLDPPLRSRFVPTEEEDIKKLADTGQRQLIRSKQLSTACEFNPMMGHRGCRQRSDLIRNR